MGDTQLLSASPTVVVVDDSADLLNALGFALQTQGFQPVTFTSADGVAAWPGLDDAACLVIDQNLPGESGLDLLARLRLAGCATPAILITTNPPKTVLGRAASMNTPVVEKPLLDDRLFTHIRASVARGPAR